MKVLKKIIGGLRRFVGWLPPAVIPAVAPVVVGAIASKAGVHVEVSMVEQVLGSLVLAAGTHAVAKTTNPPQQDPPQL